MSNTNPLLSRPSVEAPPIEQASISMISPTPVEENASVEVFDSHDNPDVKRYLSTNISRPRGPRKSSSRPVNQDLSSSAGEEASYVTAFDSPAVSLDTGSDHEEFQQHKIRPHSGVIKISPTSTWEELAQQLTTTKDRCNELTKFNLSLENKSESDTAQLAELEHALKSMRTAKNSLEPRTLKAEKQLADLQDLHHELLSKNAELEELNKGLRRETAQANSKEEKCRALNRSMVNQVAALKEDFFRKQNFIDRLKEENIDLVRKRNEALAAAQRAEDDKAFLASRLRATQELRNKNLVLEREAEEVRIQLATFEDQQHELAEDLWRNEDAQIVTRDRFDEPATGSRHCVFGSQKRRRRESIGTPALTNASTSSTSSLTSPEPLRLSSIRDDLTKKINEVILDNSDFLAGVYKCSNSNQQEASGGVPEVQALGIRVHPLAEKLAKPAKGTASAEDPSGHVNAHIQTEILPISVQQTQSDQVFGSELPVQKSTNIESRMLLEPAVVEVQVEKLPLIDSEAQPSPREAFAMMKPVTMIDESGTTLLATTYVNRGVQATPTTYIDEEVQKDPQNVEVLQSIPSEDPARFPPYTFRAKRQDLLKILSEVTIPISPNTSTEKKEEIFSWWPPNRAVKSVYNIVGSRPRDLRKPDFADEDITTSKVVIPSMIPAVRDFALEEYVDMGIEGCASPELPTLTFGIRDQRIEHAASASAREEATNFSIESNGSIPIEIGASLLGRDQDSASQTIQTTVIGPSPLSVDEKQPQPLTFRNLVSSVSNEPSSADTGPSSVTTFKFPLKSMKEYDLCVQTSDEEATRSLGVVKRAYPRWYYAGLGWMIMVFLTHAFFAEQRFWRDANELTRHAVVSMRDERWGSDWVERMGYTLYRQLGVDRTGFC